MADHRQGPRRAQGRAGRRRRRSSSSALATIPGFFGVGGGPGGGRALRRVPARAGPRRPRARSTSCVLGGDRTVVDSVAPGRPASRSIRAGAGAAAAVPGGATVPARRSAASSAPAPATRAATPTSACSPAPTRPAPGSTRFLTVERLQALLPETADLEVDRYPLPNLRSLNFVIHGLLAGGRGRVDPPGRPGQEPRRVAAGPCRRHPRHASSRAVVTRRRPLASDDVAQPPAAPCRAPAARARPASATEISPIASASSSTSSSALVARRLRRPHDGRAGRRAQLLAAHPLRAWRRAATSSCSS